MKCTNMEGLENLLLNAKDVLIMTEKEFTVECCVRVHHVYQSKWKQKSTVNWKLVKKQDLVHL